MKPVWSHLAVAVFGAALGGVIVWLFFRPELPPDPHSVSLAPGTYVAIGDSYSAGEGLPPWEQGTGDIPQGDRCHRSAHDAYPLLIWWEGMTDRQFRACSGAEVRFIFDETQTHGNENRPDVENHLGRQIAPGVLSDASLITITIGGNDVGFAAALAFCGLRAPWDTCLDDTFDPENEYKQDPPLQDWITGRFGALRPSLQALYATLKQEAPTDARIVVLGYPSLFPERIQLTCLGEFHLFNKTERSAFIKYGSELNAMIREEAQRSGLEYLDVSSLFVTHEPCGAGGDDWIRFPTPQRRYGWFHPNETGQAKLARAVLCYLSSNPDSPTLTPTTADSATRECFNSSDVFPGPPAPAITSPAPVPSDVPPS